MATLTLEQLDDDLVRRLEERAAAHGRTLAAEHRAILEEALRPPHRPQARTGADLAAALRGEGPWLDDGWDERMRELDQPVTPRPSKDELLASAARIRAANRPPPPGQRWPTAEEMIRENRGGKAELLAEIDRIRAMTPPLPPGAEPVPGWVLIREDRDSR